MEFYQRIGEAISWDELDEIWKEVLDRFGAPPEVAQWLYAIAKLRIFASIKGFSMVKCEKLSLSWEMQQKGNVVTRKIPFALPKKPEEIGTKLIPILVKAITC